MLKSIARQLARTLLRRYPREYGKHSLLTRIYFPYLAPPRGSAERVRIFNGLLMDLDPSEYLQAFIYNFGGYEFPSLRLIQRVVRKNDVVLDIGAQVGFMSLVFANLVGPEGHVYSFEPEPTNLARLQKNIAINQLKCVHPHQVAISDREGPLRLYLGKGENTGVHSTLFNERTMMSTAIDVPSVPIDTFLTTQNISHVDFVKIDIEGAELPAIRGMKDLLKRDAPLLLMEISAELQNLSGLSVRAFKSVLYEEYGYEAYHIRDDGTLTPSAIGEFHLNENLLFVRTDRSDRIAAVMTR